MHRFDSGPRLQDFLRYSRRRDAFLKKSLIRISSLVCVWAVAATAQEAAPFAAREWGKVAGSYQLSISTDKSAYLVGEPVKVTTILKNVSDKQTALIHRPSFDGYEMDVTLPYPSWIPFSPRAVLTPFGEKQQFPAISSTKGGYVQAGHESFNSFELNALYGMSAPGEYKIVFSCKQPLREWGDPEVTVTSNELKIAILDKPR